MGKRPRIPSRGLADGAGPDSSGQGEEELLELGAVVAGRDVALAILLLCGAFIASEATRRPLGPLPKAAREGLLELARRRDPLVLRWRSGLAGPVGWRG
jgi:hypothetical protein